MARLSSTVRCVLVTKDTGTPLVGIDIELVRTDTMAMVEVVTTNKAGQASFSVMPLAPFFFRPRIIGHNWALETTAMGFGKTIYDRVVDQNGLGTDLTITAAIAALVASDVGGTIGVCSGTYTEYFTIPAMANGEGFIIEGIGETAFDFPNPDWSAPKIYNASTSAHPIITVANSAQLTLRGIFVDNHASGQPGIKGGSGPDIILDHVRIEAGGYAVDAMYGFNATDSYLKSTTNNTTNCKLRVHCSRTTLVAPTGFYSHNNYFGEFSFDECIMAKFRVSSLVASSDLRIADCTVAGIYLAGPVSESDDVTITGNIVDGGTGDAIYLSRLDRVVCSNNRLKTTGGQGIHIAGAIEGGTFTGNVCEGNAAGYTIATDDASYVALCSFAGNAHDGTMLGTYGSLIPGATVTRPHTLLDGVVHSDTLLGVVLDGDMLIGNATPKWSRVAITIPGAASLMNVWSVVNGELRGSWRPVLDATNPENIGAAAAPGTSLIFAHRDHVHTDTLRHAAVTLDVNADTVLSLSAQALGLDEQTIHTFFAGPVPPTASAVPTFRTIVASDLPDLSAYYATVGCIWDADDDTGVQVEEGADDDIIRFDAAGAQIAYIDADGLNVGADVGILNSGSLEQVGNIGFFGTAPTTQQTVTGAKGSNAALGSLLTALAAYGIIVDSSEA